MDSATGTEQERGKDWDFFGYTGNGIVILTEEEMELTKRFAEMRHAINTGLGVRDQRVSYENENRHLEYAVEWAFCKLMNVYPDIQNNDWGKPDAVMINGTPVDVKLVNARGYISIRCDPRSTKQQPSHLVYAAMSAYGENTFRLIWWATRLELLAQKKFLRTGPDGVPYLSIPVRGK